MNLPEYIKTVEANVYAYGGDGSVVYSASASSAMIYSYNILSLYTNVSKRKKPPIPILVTSKSTPDGDETYTCFKFASNDINLNTLNRVVHTNGGIQANIVEYGSTINLEIYTTNKRQKEY